MVNEEFVSHGDQRQFPLKIGSLIASGLAGFLAGVVFGAGGAGLIFWALQNSPR